MSLARSTERSRSAKEISTRSPIGWPSSSLIALNPSRSMIRTQVGVRSRWPRSRACHSRSWKSSRFGRPVSASCSDRWTSWASSAFRSVMSSTIITRWAAWPSADSSAPTRRSPGPAPRCRRPGPAGSPAASAGCGGRASRACASSAAAGASGCTSSSTEWPCSSSGRPPDAARRGRGWRRPGRPAGVVRPIPMGALANALRRSAGGSASTTSITSYLRRLCTSCVTVPRIGAADAPEPFRVASKG